MEVLDGARFLPVDVNWAEVQDISGAVLEDAILLNRLSAEEAGKKASDLANASIDRQRAVLSKPKVPRGWFLMLQLSVAIAFGAMLLAQVLAQRRRSRLQNSEERTAWIFLTPWALGFIFLLAGPAAVSLLLSLTEWSPVRLGRKSSVFSTTDRCV